MSEADDLALEQKYNELGLYTNCYNGKVVSVYLAIPPEVWVDAFDKEGTSLPYECPNIELVRSFLIAAAHNGRIAKTHDLYDVYTVLRDNYRDKAEKPNKIGPTANLDDSLSLVDYLMNVWETIASDAKQEKPLAVQDSNDIKNAISIVSRACSYIRWDDFFSTHPNRDVLNVVGKVETSKLAKAIKIVYANICDLYEEPVNGFAVCRDNEVAESPVGYCIYQTEDVARDLVYRHPDEKLTVRPVMVSSTGGIEFTDEVAT